MEHTVKFMRSKLISKCYLNVTHGINRVTPYSNGVIT